jgi:hypothetical protein
VIVSRGSYHAIGIPEGTDGLPATQIAPDQRRGVTQAKEATSSKVTLAEKWSEAKEADKL